MTLSYDEAAAQITAPGERFEVGPIEVNGIPYTAFTSVPTTLQMLFDLTKGFGEAPYLVYEDESYTFTQTHELGDAFAAVLVNKYGVKKGDRVAIAMRNYPEWIMAYIGAISVGAVVVSMNAWWTPEEMAYGLEDSGTSVLVADPERIERSRDAAAKLGFSTVGVRTDRADNADTFDRWEDIVIAGT